MNRSEVMDKIRAMMALKEGTSFEQEADNAAKMIDRLCEKYGVTVADALTPEVNDEGFQSFKRLDNSIAILFSAVATFYDAKAYVSHGKELKLIGTEAQQIQTRLYYEYLNDCMEAECKKAHAAEKILSELTGQSLDRGFKKNFKIAFARSVHQRLIEKKKEENRIHEHAEYTKNTLSTMRFTRRSSVGARGDGAFSGDSAGNSVSLHRQANGSAQRQLTGVC
jgi:hypothetical protein